MRISAGTPEPPTTDVSRARRDAAEARLVTAGGVPVDDALAGHLVDQRDGLLERGLRAGQIVAVDRGADVLERVAQTRTELAVAARGSLDSDDAP